MFKRQQPVKCVAGPKREHAEGCCDPCAKCSWPNYGQHLFGSVAGPKWEQAESKSLSLRLEVKEHTEAEG